MYGNKPLLHTQFIDGFHLGCWCTLPHHGHDQEEEGGAEGRGGETERGGGIPQQDQQGQTATQAA